MLKELIDSNSTIMERFRDRAPGTYKHCQSVASLCDAVGTTLKLPDPLILRTAASVHDIGKTFNAEHFTENQNGVNIHDELTPMMSYHLLTRHVSDSVLYLLQYPEIPKNVLEIISQHHGNTILTSIYQKAKLEDKGVNEDYYRYISVKPQSTEAAVLMIADSVEATARSMFNNGSLEDSKSRQKVIDCTIDNLVNDQQLDELKIGIIRVIKEVLLQELESTYHKRLNYTKEITEE